MVGLDNGTPVAARALIDVTGLVQGVGFRPFVYALATSLNLRGYVQNRGAHLFVDVEGDPRALDTFVSQLTAAPPPLALIDHVHCRRTGPIHPQAFVIADSTQAQDAAVRVPVDVATCDACRAELFDPANRRYRHPFITCTSCGPRFSIITGMPYDRARTTMAMFEMCDACRRDYADPRDRRFHAQAIACPQCGPTLIARDVRAVHHRGDAALRSVVKVLLDGGIVAIKGLGGFHLACDATNYPTVAELRRRKGREAKPFAVMLPHFAGHRDVNRDDGMREALASPERPIALIDRAVAESMTGAAIASNIAAGCPTLGVLLPYTPVHLLLLNDTARPLVMTSGNRSDEPMAHEDDEALEQLGAIADIFLTHDRRIEVRCDDSVIRVFQGRVSTVRRARGHAPTPLRLAERTPAAVLGVGGHLKNTFSLVSGHHAYLSHHIGDLETAASYRALGDSVQQLTRLLKIEPAMVAHDLHPDYLSTRFALEFPADRRVAVQHHHAHVLSCLAEHGCTEPVLGVAFDGSGLGTDGAVWGGEFLFVEGSMCQRLAHLAYVPLPGADMAAREPWRMAVAHLAAAYGSDLGPTGAALAHRIPPAALRVVQQMAARGVCAPHTSSMGRLFDAVAAIVGLRDRAQFEGQAAMELEAIASGPASSRYRFDLMTDAEVWTVDSAPVIRAVAADVAMDRSPAEISAAFHEAVGAMIALVATRLARRTGVRRVVLTGGVFQNALLSSHAARALSAADLDVLQHCRVPCNDGGLSVGQALLAMRVARKEASRPPVKGRIACA